MQKLLETETKTTSIPADAAWVESEAREKQRRYQRNWKNGIPRCWRDGVIGN